MLTKCPQSVYDLWKVYELVFSGCKPAKDWTGAERGNDHFKYYEEYFWVLVLQMIRAGHTAEGATDFIHRACGANLSLTKIINKMIAEKTNWRTSCIKNCCCRVSFNG